MAMGRPQKVVDISRVNALRAQGLTWGDVAIWLGVHRNTLNRAIQESNVRNGEAQKKQCGGYCQQVLSVAEFSIDRSRRDGLNVKCRKCVSRRWKELYSSPCVDCGGPRRSPTPGQCARCYRMTALLKREEWEVASLIGRLISEHRQQLMGDLAKDERMRPVDKLLMLVDRVTNGTPRNITTKG